MDLDLVVEAARLGPRERKEYCFLVVQVLALRACALPSAQMAKSIGGGVLETYRPSPGSNDILRIRFVVRMVGSQGCLLCAAEGGEGVYAMSSIAS